MNNRPTLGLWCALAALVLWGAILQIQASGFDFACKVQPGSCKEHSAHAVLSLELALSGARFQNIIDQGDRAHNVSVMRINTYLDVVFIGLYWTVFFFLAATSGIRGRNGYLDSYQRRGFST